MTLSTSASQTIVAGNGITTVFNFSFVAGVVSNIQVIYTDASGHQTTLLPSQFSVNLNLAATGQLWGVGGTVTYPISGSPITAGTSLTISRLVPLSQNTSISNQGNEYPQVIEAALDTLCMQIQQVSARTGALRGTWITATAYNFGDVVQDGANGNNTANFYQCAIANTSGIWASDVASGYWSLAINVEAIVNALPVIGNNQMFANITGGASTPTGVGGSAFLDSVFGKVRGDILYRNASVWTVLAPGTSGQILQTGGSSGNPSWTNSATSGVAAAFTPTGTAVPPTGMYLHAANYLGFATSGAFNAGLDSFGNFGIAGIFAGTGVNLSGLTASRMVLTDGSQNLISASAPLTSSLGADVNLTDISLYFDGPSVAQGTTGTWFVSASILVTSPGSGDQVFVKLWDGTTVIASTEANVSVGTGRIIVALSGYITSPAANLKISARDSSSTSGKILFNSSGNSKDSTITAIRIG